MKVNFTRSAGVILPSIFLILTGLAGLGPLMALLALLAGILILIGI